MIRCEGLTKEYIRIGNQTEDHKKTLFKSKEKAVPFYAVDHISLEAKEGEILGILGPNGAGKTTLLRMLGGLLEATEGKICITKIEDDTDYFSDQLERKRRIGYLSNNTALYERFSIRETLAMIGEIYGLNPALIKMRSDAIISALRMEDFADERIGHLSTGQTQKASIARCFIHDPDIFIFDEPTLGLDIMTSKVIIDMMQEQKSKGKTVLYSTHYMEEAEKLCDRIIMLHNGQIIAEGTPAAIMSSCDHCNSLRDAFFKIVWKGANK